METTDVLIVGAGPTGLTMACILARYGIPFVHVERNTGPSIHSKALVIQARTLELFEQLGMGHAFLDTGEKAIALNMVTKGIRRARIPFSDIGQGLTQFPYLFILEQFKTEKLLLGCLEQTHHQPIWNTELVSFAQDADGVTATLHSLTDQSTRQIRAKYLVAADGARSTVRHQLQLSFDGGTYENRFYVADVEVVGDVAVASQEISVCPGYDGFLGFFPMKGTPRRFRTVGILPASLYQQEEITFDDIRHEVTRVGFPATTGFDLRDSRWHSVYRLHHRYVNKMNVQRAFLAGDAAHIHSPAGGQGMNTGIQDAFNLGWKLVYVLRGWSSPSLLDTYHVERHPIAKVLVNTTDRAFGIVTSQNPLAKFLRMVIAPKVVPLALRLPLLRRFIFRMISQIGISYPQSPLSQPAGWRKSGAWKAGQRLPDTILDDGTSLHRKLSQGTWLLLCVGRPELAAELQSLFSSRWGDVLQCCATHPTTPLPASFEHFPHGQIFLLRPDGYLGFSLKQDTPAGRTQLATYLTTWLPQNIPQ